MKLLYLFTTLSLAQLSVADTQVCGYSLSFCKIYPDLCSTVVDEMLDGYTAGLPWTAVVNVEEGVAAGNASTMKQCMAVLVSEQDLLLATDCFDPSSGPDSAANSSSTVHVANSSYPLSQFKAARLNGVVLISLDMGNSSSIGPANKSIPYSCVPSSQYVAIEGAVCGFLRNGYAHNHLSYTCRRVHFTASIPSNSSEKEPWKDFQPGAAVFDHSNDLWSLLGFTTTPTTYANSLYRLADNCDLLRAQSGSRVQCTSVPRANNVVDNWGNPLYNPNNLATALYDKSGLIPLTVVGLIIVLGVVLIVHCFATRRQRSTYSDI